MLFFTKLHLQYFLFIYLNRHPDHYEDRAKFVWLYIWRYLRLLLAIYAEAYARRCHFPGRGTNPVASGILKFRKWTVLHLGSLRTLIQYAPADKQEFIQDCLIRQKKADFGRTASCRDFKPPACSQPPDIHEQAQAQEVLINSNCAYVVLVCGTIDCQLTGS